MCNIGHAPIIYDDIRGILSITFEGDVDGICAYALKDLGAVAGNVEFDTVDGRLNLKIGSYSAYLITR